MPSNATGRPMREVVADYPAAQLQSLYPPAGWHAPWLAYALDNGAYGAFLRGRPWDEAAFLKLCDKAALADLAPRWVAVPDVVGDWPATLRSWERWAPRLRSAYGWDLAVCVQDGATPAIVRGHTDAALIFVGGRNRFKWATFRRWCAHFPRVHVGRVNRVEWAIDCAKAGVESIDGTGWMRTDRQRAGLRRLLDYLTATERPALPLGLDAA